MRRLIALIMMCVLLAVGMTAAAEESQPVKVMGFVYDKCGNCGVTVNKPGCGECAHYLDIFAKIRIELMPLIQSGAVEFDLMNVQPGYDRPTYYAYCQAFGVAEEEVWTFPHIFIGAPEDGVHLSGYQNESDYEDIEGLLEEVEAYIAGLTEGARASFPDDEVVALAATLNYDGTAVEEDDGSEMIESGTTEESEKEFVRNDDLNDVGDDDTKIVYVYKPNCEFCAKVKPLLEGLPSAITLPDGSSSRVVFVSLNKDDYDQYQIVKQYYDALQIPEDHRYSPLLIVGDKFYMGYDEIVPNLLNAMLAGDGVNTDLTPILEAE